MTRIRRVVVLSAWLLAAGMPGVARADSGTDAISILDCGEISRSNNSWQFGPNAWLQYIVETSRSINLCPIEVEVEAWVNGVPNSATSDRAAYHASVMRQVPVPRWGNWTTSGKHWFIWVYINWYQAGATASVAGVYPVQQSAADQCASQGADYYWNGGDCIWTPGSPIVIDLARDGYHFTSAEDGVLFDLDGDGVPERVAWTRAGSDDAFLALDRNNNGRIDDGTELFGNYTPVRAGSTVTAANGFEALKFLESPLNGPIGMVDGIIDARDPAWSRLLLWRDLNHNGISEPDELQSVAAAGLAAIDTDYKPRKKVDRFGNEFRQAGHATWSDGEVSTIFDVWLQMRN